MKTEKLTIITKKIVEVPVYPCIHCGSDDIFLTGSGSTNFFDERIINAICICNGCKKELNIPKDVVFKNIVELYEYWNKQNDTTRRIEVLLEQKTKIDQELEKLAKIV